MSADDALLAVGGESLRLLPQRAVLWTRRRTVIVADTHFGKSALLRQHGLAVPAGSDAHDRERLSGLLAQTDACRLIVLGDFLHGPLAADQDDAAALMAWRATLPAIEIVVVAGNHDRGGAEPWRSTLTWMDRDLVEDGFLFTHDAAHSGSHDARLFTLSGHLHPCARIGGPKGRGLRVPVFWRRRAGLVLPSFGLFTGGMLVRPEDGEQLFAAGSERVIRLN
jgi:DNA ligase-associated metallophosphoesterase